MGYGAILFFGRPEYQPQFGFREVSEFGVSDSEGNNYPIFMGMELIPKYFSVVRGGKYYVSDLYNDNLNRDSAKGVGAKASNISVIIEMEQRNKLSNYAGYGTSHLFICHRYATIFSFM